MKTKTFVAVVAVSLAISPLRSQPATPAPSSSPAAAAAADKADLSQFKSADDLWAHLQKLQKGPEKRPETKSDYIAYLKELQSASSEFVARYPQDSRRFEVKLAAAQIGNAVAELAETPGKPKAVAEVCKEILAAKDAPNSVRREARFLLLQDELSAGADEKAQKEVDAFCKDYPDDSKEPMGAMLKLMLAKKIADPAKASALLNELAKNSNEEIASEAKSEIRLGELKGKPLELKFTAVDGAEVDLSKLKGKVVLVDFWATWCGPCMMEVPHVVEAYKKLHSKGFEIIGISLDQNKDAMLKVTKAKEMTWPQYFDGKGWQNAISSKFGIESIPTMWLINKKGMLVNTDAREDLQGAVEKLLAE